MRSATNQAIERIIVRCGLTGACLVVLLLASIAVLPLPRWLSAPLVVAEAIRPVDAIVVLGAGVYDRTTLKPQRPTGSCVAFSFSRMAMRQS